MVFGNRRDARTEDLIASLRKKASSLSTSSKWDAPSSGRGADDPRTEFRSFASSLAADLTFMQRNVDQLYELNLGGTP